MRMRFGYWLPVFGGWLRNVDDEEMATTWDYVSRLAAKWHWVRPTLSPS
jgi:FMNH2-dependent dimethyl sulfone monooxygenase